MRPLMMSAKVHLTSICEVAPTSTVEDGRRDFPETETAQCAAFQ